MHTTMLCRCRRVLDRDDMFALPAGIAELRYRRCGILEQPGAKGRIGPGPRHHAGAIARPNLGLVGLDQQIERGRIDIAFFGQDGFQRAHAQLGLGQFRMVVIVVVMIVIGHVRRIGAIFWACRDAAAVKGKSMPTISRGRTPLTLINIFTVPSEKQDELIALLTEVTRRSVRHHKGFISASLHRGVDGKKVAMYAQWASIEDYECHASKSRSGAGTGAGAQTGDVRSRNVRGCGDLSARKGIAGDAWQIGKIMRKQSRNSGRVPAWDTGQRGSFRWHRRRCGAAASRMAPGRPTAPMRSIPPTSPKPAPARSKAGYRPRPTPILPPSPIRPVWSISCRPVELSMQTVRSRSDGEWSTTLAPKAKTNIVAHRYRKFGVAFYAGGSFDA